ncbi:MAG TPA: low molecular weight protein-tyrosine-phosphatase [Solirubrobacteraceae bacterium]|jgi:protein-tyrosine phosphatase|nr:low molecular weight protein-tyrosine-phosphatase [Solirubrobacteraceae bacterium]
MSDRAARPVRLLFVCLGNICRSPTAEGVMRALVTEAGMQDDVELDSAGTGAWHAGSGPDERAAAAARSRGVILDGVARRVTPEDFEEFDLLLAMDGENLRELEGMAADESQRAKVRLLREFDPAPAAASAPSAGATAGGRDLDVPDPYYGADGGFEEVFELVRAACEGLVAEIRAGRAP